MFVAWLVAFAFTTAVEAPVYRLALTRRRDGRDGIGSDRGALRPWLWAAGLSLPTHPVVWFVFPRLWPGGWLDQTLAAEAFAVGVEAAILARLGVPLSLAWALAANALSVALGLTARWLWGWP